tara:strand:- start:32 stop:811 length:780 start_codon:yes stop_codon:yes gene_type:complete
MSKRVIIINLLLFFLFGCSLFNKGKEEISNQAIFDRGKEYLDKNKFEKAKNNFKLIIESEKGALSLESHFYLGKAFFELDDYEQSLYHYNYYSMFSKNIEHIEFSQFMKCKCTFKMALPYKNDQNQSFFAISTIQEFLDNFPLSKHKDDAYQMIQDLRNRISKQYFETARLYLKMKKYNSAFYYLDLVLSDYYDTKYSDEAKITYIFTYILMGDFEEAKKYFDINKQNFKNDKKLKEAENLLVKYKDRLGFSGYFRLYK